jgi:hypothetical protein
MITPILCSVLGFFNPGEAAIATGLTQDSGEFTFHFDPAVATDDVSLALIQDEPASVPFGLAGSASWLVNVAGASTFRDDHMVRGGIGISYFIADDFSVDFEFDLAYFPQEGDDAVGGNFNLLLRWHFLHDETRSWTVYLDGGAGMLWTTDNVPSIGSSFNFTPQFGAGASFDLGNDKRLYVGGRWFHVSNARLYDENPGRDYGMLYVMFGWPF